MKKIRLACIGAGYFAQFHVEAWQRLPEVDLVAICDHELEKAKALAKKHGVKNIYASVEELYHHENLDVVDIITPPKTHLDLCLQAAKHGVHIICQKPLAPTLTEAEKMVQQVESNGVRLLVHENWRFKPWYRQIKKLLKEGAIGQVHSIYFQMRMGDGWPKDAYLARQPYFRTMPQLLVYETGIHFIDTFRYLVGEPVTTVFAQLKRLNPEIVGEDAGIMMLNFNSGARAIWDANRYNESNLPNARYTFGTMLVEGKGGSIRLAADGTVTLQPLGQPERKIEYFHEDKNFAGDCVYFLQQHFVDCLLNDKLAETEGSKYLTNLAVQEAVYRSSDEQRVVTIGAN